MKRNNGGYVLVYVVVVIVILCILVPAACSNSLQNLKAQQASIERMQQLYAAEGEIERFVAEMSEQVVMSSSEEKQGDIQIGQSAVAEKFKAAFDSAASTLGRQQLEEADWNNERTQCLHKILVVTKEEDINVSAEITIALTTTIATNKKWENETWVEYCTYQITDCTITYESYDISATTESGSEGGGT